MCSIAGLHGDFTPEERRKFTIAALINGEDRGKHSGGVYTGGKLIRRCMRPYRMTPIVAGTSDDIWTGPVTLVHTRHASRGAIKTRNAHPIPLEGDAVVIHNGTVEAMEISTYAYNGETDTERLAALIVRKGLKKAAKLCKGSVALAIFFPGDTDRPPELVLWRVKRPLWIVRFDDDGYGWASTEHQLMQAVAAAGLLNRRHKTRMMSEGEVLQFRNGKVRRIFVHMRNLKGVSWRSGLQADISPANRPGPSGKRSGKVVKRRQGEQDYKPVPVSQGPLHSDWLTQYRNTYGNGEQQSMFDRHFGKEKGGLPN